MKGKTRWANFHYSIVILTTAVSVECEAYEERRLWPQNYFSSYRLFKIQNPLNFLVLWVNFNTKVSLEKLQKFALTSLDLP